MDNWLSKATAWANIGSFIIAAALAVIFIWDRIHPQSGQPVVSVGNAGMGDGWLIPIALCLSLLLAGGLHLAAAIVSRGEKASSSQTRLVTPPALPLKEDEKETNAATQDERIPANIRLKDLVKLGEGLTAAQANKLLVIYIGKWMRITGVVEDVEEEDKRLVVGIWTDLEEVKSLSTVYFCEKRWIERAMLLRRRDQITVQGQIKHINSTGWAVILEKCELIDVKQMTRAAG